MNDDMISRSALLAALVEGGILPAMVRRTIERAPAVEAVPVVRCKDCMWSYRVDCREPKYACRNICRFGCSQWLDSNDFCSYGERKEPDGQ